MVEFSLKTPDTSNAENSYDTKREPVSQIPRTQARAYLIEPVKCRTLRFYPDF